MILLIKNPNTASKPRTLVAKDINSQNRLIIIGGSTLRLKNKAIISKTPRMASVVKNIFVLKFLNNFILDLSLKLMRIHCSIAQKVKLLLQLPILTIYFLSKFDKTIFVIYI